MLQISRKGKIHEAQKWDELHDYELIEIFRRINAQWYNAAGRLELSTWLYTEQCSDKFIINKLKYNNGLSITFLSQNINVISNLPSLPFPSA